MNNIIEKFIDKIMEASLKPGEKKKIPVPKNLELSPEAKKVLKKVSNEKIKKREKIKLLKKYEAEYKRLNALLNKHYLKKNKLSNDIRDLDVEISVDKAKYFTKIEKECSDFIKTIKSADNFLFRGIKNNEPVLYGFPHDQRATKDTKEEVQKIFDEYLKMANFKALRSNSIFCTSNYHTATTFGYHVYIIFPKNGFDFTWSKKQEDWVPKYQDFPHLNFDFDLYWFKTASYAVLDIIEDIMLLKVEKLTNNDISDDGIRSHFSSFFYNYSGEISLSKFKEISEYIKNNPKLYNNISQLKSILYTLSTENLITLKKERIEMFKEFLEEFFKFEKKFQLQIKSVNTDENFDKQNNSFEQFLKITSDPNFQKKKITKEDVEKFISDNQIFSENLEEAIKSKNEIYIHGEYIALSAKYFRRAAHYYFLGHKDFKKRDIDVDYKLSQYKKARYY